jgi:hypothetical protein
MKSPSCVFRIVMADPWTSMMVLAGFFMGGRGIPKLGH